MKPSYYIYPTLLDAYQYYLKSENENSFQELIDKINRVPFTSEAADKGTKFNQLIDKLILSNTEQFAELQKQLQEDFIQFEGYEFKSKIVNEYFEKLRYSTPQVYVEASLVSSKGIVQLYGYLDNLLYGSGKDIKTCGRYEFPKYLHNWQHIVYPYCLIKMGITEDAARVFSYEITDFNNTYCEDYIFNPSRDEKRLINVCEDFIDFIEMNRNLITDTKLFTGEKTELAA